MRSAFLRSVSAAGLAVLLSLPNPVLAYWIWSPETKTFVNPEGTVQDTAEDQFSYAMKLHEQGETQTAAKELEKLLKEYPTSTTAPKAQFQLAVVYEDLGTSYKAFQAHRDLWKVYPQSEQLQESLKRAFQIGNVFLSGKKEKVLGVPVMPALPRAEEIFSEIAKNAPYSQWGDRAHFSLGVARSRMGDYGGAIQAFQELIDLYPKSDLVSDARYQMAECTLLYSAQGERDDRVFAEAQSRFDAFLRQYPGSSSYDKALALKRELEDRKAEKDFRIGKYYEDNHYLESARIYYEDVAAKLGHTSWGEKAAERLKKLKSPETYWQDREAALAKDLERIEEKRRALAVGEREGKAPLAEEDRAMLEAERQALARDEKKLRKELRGFGKTKMQEFRARREALKRERRELTEKFKTLKKKAKLLERNPSDDLRRAIARWRDSLSAEALSLDRRERELERLRGAWGLGPDLEQAFKKWFAERAWPGRKAEARVEKLLSYKAGDLASIARKRSRIHSAKRSLYRERARLERARRLVDEELVHGVLDREEFREVLERSNASLARRRVMVAQGARRLAYLEARCAQRNRRLAIGSRSVAFQMGQSGERMGGALSKLGAGRSRESLQKGTGEHRRRRRHLAAATRAKRLEVDAIGKALDTAFQDLPAQIGAASDIQPLAEPQDPRLIRRALKELEREVRDGLEEIRDRKKAKQKKVGELADVLRQARSRRSRVVRSADALLKPGILFLRFWKAFLFGLEDQEARVTGQAEREAAKSSGTARAHIQAVREDIALENVFIAARAYGVRSKQNELLRLRIASSGRHPVEVRTILPASPQGFLRTAHDQAIHALPKQGVEEILIDRLDRETRLLTQLEEEHRRIFLKLVALREGRAELKRAKISAMAGGAPQAARPKPLQLTGQRGERARQSARRFERAIELARALLKEEEARLKRDLLQFYRESSDQALRRTFRSEEDRLSGKAQRISKGYRETSQSILKLLEEEQRLLSMERELVSDKISRFDRGLRPGASPASGPRPEAAAPVAQGERERLLERLGALSRASSSADNERQALGVRLKDGEPLRG